MELGWPAWIIVAYLCGSIPFGLLIGLAKGVDIRRVGSGNVGATNTGRALGRGWGGLCFLLDAIKGAGPVLACGWQMGWLDGDVGTWEAWRWMGIAAAAMTGHIYPVWLRFKGGKGIATGLGVLLGFWPVLTLVGLAGAGVWALTLLATRYVSVASISATVAIPILLTVSTLMNGQPLSEQAPFLISTSALAVLVVIRHRTNIVRLIAGNEPKLGQPDTPTMDLSQG